MQVKPHKDSPVGKKNQVAGMFNNISHRYDFLNHFLSMGVDLHWRSRTIEILQTESNGQAKIILDVATGTGDLAIAATKTSPDKIFGIDISTDMLAIGRQKVKKKNLSHIIELLEGDSEDLIFEDNK